MGNMRWAAVLGALLLAAVVGGIAYNAGVAHGIMQSGKIVVAPGAPYPYPYYGWYRPWSYGFFGPFVFFAFWFLVLRSLFWGRWWHRGRCRGDGAFDEWHRQAHERMSGEPRGGATGATSAP